MPKYKGNDGNLLQHWVLCEIVNACRDHVEQLMFVDAYSMAPFASERSAHKQTSTFDFVRDHLQEGHSLYEQTWLKLIGSAPRDSGYPNSAAFVRNLWQGRFSFLLCERDPATAQQLTTWSNETGHWPNCVNSQVFEEDWRDQFSQGIYPDGDLLLFSFDPYMFNARVDVKDQQPGNMYPQDLQHLASIVKRIPQGVVVQLSTYDANDGNFQEKVVECVDSSLRDCGLKIVAKAAVGEKMMSLVLTRSIQWSSCFGQLPDHFHSWLSEAKKQATGHRS